MAHDVSGHGCDGQIVGGQWVAGPIRQLPLSASAVPNSAPMAAEPVKLVQAAWGEYLGVPVESANSIGMPLVLIPPGEFLMGSTPEQVAAAKKIAEEAGLKADAKDVVQLKGEMPQHKVTISQPFWLGRTEVTVGQFKQFVEAARYVTDAERIGSGNSGAGADDASPKPEPNGLSWRAPGGSPAADNAPVSQVSWNDAVAFCNWLSEKEGFAPCYRQNAQGEWGLVAALAPGGSPRTKAAGAFGYCLPSEAQWEYACRAGTTTQFSFGDDPALLAQHGWFAGNSDGHVHPVASKLPNPFGLFDMHGNVKEWCSSERTANQARGGAYAYQAVRARSAFRSQYEVGYRYANTGFRVLRASDGRPDRRAAEWLVSAGATVFVGFVDADGYPREHEVPPGGDLPSGPIRVTAIKFPDNVRKVDTSLARLKGLVHLRYLNLFQAIRASDADAPILTSFKDLRYLRIKGNGLTDAGLAALAKLPKLDTIQLYDVPIGAKELPRLLALTGLRHLDLYGCGIDQPTYRQLLELPALARLSIYGGELTDAIIGDLQRHPRVTAVGLNGAGISVDGMHAIAVRLPLLRELQLSSTQCADAELEAIARLHDLRILYLNKTSITDAGLAHLAGLQLRSLSIRETKITASGVARLHAALPVCKIEWDGGIINPAPAGSSPTPQLPLKPITTYQQPAFQQWMKDVAKLPAEKQIDAVSKKLMQLNPGFDGRLTDIYATRPPLISGGVVTAVGLVSDRITDLSPLRVLTGLKKLRCSGSESGTCQLSDLSPLAGMKLTQFTCTHTQIFDLSPLSGMPLTNLYCNSTNVADVSPLRGAKLTTLHLGGCRVSDLSPLAGMPLTALWIYDTKVTDLSPLAGMKLERLRFAPATITRGIDVVRQMKSLQSIGVTWHNEEAMSPVEFWRRYDAGEFNTSAAAKSPAYLDPSFQQWMKDVAKLPAEKQIDAVRKKLVELNPGFDAHVTSSIENGAVVELKFAAEKVTDLSPVRALAAVKRLSCMGPGPSQKGPLVDLSPLAGLPLEQLDVSYTQVRDLAPLAGMPLVRLRFSNTQVADLAPLAGMKLMTLSCTGTQVRDLSPLKGMPLADLHVSYTPVVDLSPLVETKLRTLFCSNMSLADLSPLRKIETLGRVRAFDTQATQAEIEALQKALPNCKIEWPESGRIYGGTSAGAAAPPAADAQRWAAEWVLAQGGTVTVETMDAKGKVVRATVSAQGALPAGEIAVVEIRLLRSTPEIAGATARLAVLSELRLLDLGPAVRVGEADLATLADLKKVWSFSFHARHLTDEALANLARFPALTILRLHGFPLTPERVRWLLTMTRLQGIYLSDSSIDEAVYRQLLDLPNLTRMEVYDGRLGDAVIAELAKRPRIKMVGLSRCQLTSAGMRALASLSHLTSLIVADSVCTDEHLVHFGKLKNLEYLNLERTQVTDAGLAQLASLEKLRHVRVHGTKVTTAGAARLQAALPRCQVLWSKTGVQPDEPILDELE